jgi:ABC-type transport system substrate-binding protein
MALFRRSSGKDERKVLRVGLLTPVKTLHPRDAQDVVSAFVLTQIFEPPLAPPQGDQPLQPLLLREPLRREPARGDRAVFSAAVRTDTCFSDGTPLTAERIADSLRQSAELVRQAAVEVQGDRLVFVLERPNPRFDLVLTNTYAYVVLEKGGELLGTGPFMAAGGTPEELHLVRNPQYRREVPLDEIVFKCYPLDPDGARTRLLRALEAREVDLSNAVSRQDFGSLKQVRKWFQPGASTAILFFNTDKTYLAHEPVRQGLALALDRQALTKISYDNALAFTATGLLPPAMGSTRDRIRPNPDRARELLEPYRAELPDHLSLLLPWGPRPYLPHPEPMARAIASQLGEVGLRLEPVTSRDGTDFYDRIAAGQPDLALLGWIADTADPADFLESLLSSRHVPEAGKPAAVRANMSRWRDDETDAALAAFRRDPTDANRDALLSFVARKVPLLPLMYGPTIAVTSWRVRNFELPQVGQPSLADLDVQG